jgi:salicylate hydroxylase
MSGTNEPVVIAGGGIGGLSAALALAKQGIASRVLERRAEFSEAGAGIQLGPNASRLLCELGAGQALEPSVALPEALTVHDGVSGRDLTRLPLGTWIAGRHGAPYWTVHRQDLHAALLETARREPLIAIQTEAAVTVFDDHAGGVTATLASGETVHGRALIAADGLWSNLRAQVTPTGPLMPAGKCAYRGVIARTQMPPELSADDVHIWLSPGAHVVHYPVRAGREIALVAVLDDPTEGDSWSLAAPQSWVQDRAGRYPPDLKAILGAVGEWRMWSLQKVAPLASWVKGHVALLGDAAHPIFPFLAQGGVLAIEDACTLAKCLSIDKGSVAQKLAAYAAQRMPRAARVVEASSRNGRIYHLNGPMALARNAVLRATPAAQLMKGYDWLYGFRV